MKIIKRGTPTKTVYCGTCEACGTVFEADATEVVRRESNSWQDRDSVYWSCTCPVCRCNVPDLATKSVPVEHRESMPPANLLDDGNLENTR